MVFSGNIPIIDPAEEARLREEGGWLLVWCVRWPIMVGKARYIHARKLMLVRPGSRVYLELPFLPRWLHRN